MREPNKNFVYSLEDLTSAEKKELWIYLKTNDTDWFDCDLKEVACESDKSVLSFNGLNWEWDNTIKLEEATNAKELFYTLENVQVDCSELSEVQIKEMADVYEKSGFDIELNEITDEHFYLRLAKCGEGVDLFRLDDTKATITYEKFMELFGNKEENFKKFTIREYSTGDFMDLGRDAGVITAKNKDHAWELYKETHKLKDSEKGFYSFTESATTSVVTKEGNNDLAEETSVYDDMLSIIEKGKQQGLKVVITFERL